MPNQDLISCAEALLHAVRLYEAGRNGVGGEWDELYTDVLRDMIEKFCKTIETRLKEE